jgi:hypothetical protein
MLRKKIQEIINYSQEKGITATIKKLGFSSIKILSSFVYSNWVELVLYKDITCMRNIEAQSGWWLTKLNVKNQQEFTTFLKIYNPDKSPRIIENYIKNGYQAFLGYLDGNLIGYMWWHDNSVKSESQHPILKRYEIELKNNEVYMFDYFIPPVYRGQGNASIFLMKIYLNLKNMGFDGVWGGVKGQNLAARFIYQLHGWKVKSELELKEFFKLIMISNGKTYIRNFHFNNKHRFDYNLLFSYKI